MQGQAQQFVSVAPHRRAAIYVRVSTDKQEENGTSLITQEEKCLEYCANNKYVINERYIYRDVWTGTEYLERPELSRLREDARDRLFDVVVIYAFDRLARKQVHQAVIIEDLRRSEIKIESVTENFDDSAIGQFMRNSAAFAAEFEHEKIKERTQRGRIKKLRNGQLLGAGIAPYGYDWNKDRTAYVINPQEAKILKKMFNMYAYENYSIRGIMHYLRQTVPTKRGGNRKWSASVINRILANTSYIGQYHAYKWHEIRENGKRKTMEVRPMEERIPMPTIVTPVIIDQETFEIVQAKLAVNKQRATRNSKHAHKSLLRGGFAICGHCDNNLLFQKKIRKRVNRDDKEFFVYACHKIDSTNRCNKVCINADILDAAVWQVVSEFIEDQSKVEARLAEIEEKLTHNQVEDLQPIENQLLEVERQLQNCALGIAKAQSEFIINQLIAQSETLSRTQKELEELREKVKGQAIDRERVRQKIDQFRNRWLHKIPSLVEEPTLEDKRDAIEILGLCAIVYSSGHNPRYRIEMRPLDIVSQNSLSLLLRPALLWRGHEVCT